MMQRDASLAPTADLSYPGLAEGDEDDEDGEAEDDLGSLPSASPSSMKPPSSASSGRRKKRTAKTDYAPMTAQGLFEQALEVDVSYGAAEAEVKGQGEDGKGTFRVYYTPARPSPSKSTSTSTPSSPFGGFAMGSPNVPATSSPTSASNVAKDALDLHSIRPPILSDSDDESDAGPSSSSQGSGTGPAGGAKTGAGTLFVFHHGAGYSGLSYALVAKEITRLTGGEAGVLAFDCRGHGEPACVRC